MTTPVQIEGVRFLVVGLGASGVAVALLLARKGGAVTANDGRQREALDADILDTLEDAGVVLVFGHHDSALFVGSEHIVVSPGVPLLPGVKAAEMAGLPISGEVEVASWFIDAPIVAVTGTNGKSTVVSLLGAIATASGRPCFVGGNLGRPLSEAVGTAAANRDGLVIVELSSFQLERMSHFRASVAALLNLSEDHFERYPGIEEYAAAKAHVFDRQTRADAAVIPAGDAYCRSLWANGDATLHMFGEGGTVRLSKDSPKADVHVYDSVSGLSLDVDALKIRGTHNAMNAAAAALIARLAGFGVSAIRTGLTTFSGLPHRMEYVRTLEGVVYYDDSKATNVGATVAALTSLSGPVVLIAGGKDKGGDLSPLASAMANVRELILIGEAAERFEASLAHLTRLHHCGSLGEAVQLSARLARTGDTVLLAPACSSFDMFPSFAVRGERFQEHVNALKTPCPTSLTEPSSTAPSSSSRTAPTTAPTTTETF